MDYQNENDNSNMKHNPEEPYGTVSNYETVPAGLVPVLKTPEETPENVPLASEEKDETPENPEEPGEPKKKKKLTRKERKEEKKKQAEYEKQLVKEGKIAPRYRYQPRNSFARIVSVCVAFVLGFFASFGAVIAGFTIFGNKKLKDVSEIAGLDYQAIFTDYSANLSALDLVVEVVQKISGGEFTNLNSVAIYTPYVDTLADGVVTQLSNAGFTVEKDELMELPFTELGAWFQEHIMDAFTGDYTLGEVISINENSPVILQTLKDTLVSDLPWAIDNLTLTEILGADQIGSNKILKNLGGSTLKSLSGDVQKLTVEQVFGDEMYSYLSIDANNGKTYTELVENYDPNDASSPRPISLTLNAGDEIKFDEAEGSYYLLREGEDPLEVDRYLDGTWYLLFGKDEENGGTDLAQTPILEMGTHVTNVIKKVNEMRLWELWFHGIITVGNNPYKPISFREYTNLNQFTISDLIDYVMQLPQIG